MKIVCLDAATLGSDVNLDVFKQFGEFKSYQTTAADERIERLKGADVVITNKVVIDKETMDASNLKLICISATGMNNVDLAHAAASCSKRYRGKKRRRVFHCQRRAAYVCLPFCAD